VTLSCHERNWLEERHTGCSWTAGVCSLVRIVAYVTTNCFYIPSDQELPILSEGASECSHRTKVLEWSKEGKGEAACTVHLSLDLRTFATMNHVNLYPFFNFRTLFSLQRRTNIRPSVLTKKFSPYEQFLANELRS
jgi:hypothetical protein